jgi:hypothetical protein
MRHGLYVNRLPGKAKLPMLVSALDEPREASQYRHRDEDPAHSAIPNRCDSSCGQTDFHRQVIAEGVRCRPVAGTHRSCEIFD